MSDSSAVPNTASSLFARATSTFDAKQLATFRSVVRFDPDAGQLPESLTMDGAGNVFMTMANVITKVAPDGRQSTYASLPLPGGAFALGIKVGPDGALYCASGGFDQHPDAAAIWRIDRADHAVRFAKLDARGFPNDLVFDAAGAMYVTEPFLARIYRIDQRGDVQTWLAHESLAGNPDAPVLAVHAFGADGLALDATEENLYVGNLDAGAIVRIPIGADGSAGTPETFVQNSLLKGADGIAFDRSGTLYVAVNGADRLIAVGTEGQLRVLGEGGVLDAPSSVVFGTQPGDEHTLYIACFAINRAMGAHPGAPRPALLALQVDAPGLPLR
jgi:sugar lactone lactonase YvrE